MKVATKVNAKHIARFTSLTFVFLLFFCINLKGQNQEDSLVVDESRSKYARTIDTSTYEVYRSNSDYQYEEVRYEESNLRRMWRRFWSRFFKSLGKGLSSEIFQYIIIIVAAAGVIYFILKSQFANVIRKEPTEKRSYVEELDIRVSENVLEEKWKHAKNNKDWRNAIRYAYLISLKKLDEKKLIQWKEWKLSEDYVQELKHTEWKQDFTDMTKFFNYSWYGQGELHQEGFQKFEGLHHDFLSRLKQS